MKKYLGILLTSLLMLFIGVSQAETLQGDGNSQTVKRTVASFNGLDLRGSYIFNVTVGQPQSISITGDSNILPNLLTDVSNNTLIVHYSDSFFSVKPSKPITINITVPSLQNLVIRGNNSATVTQISGSSLNVSAMGTAKLVLSGSVDTLMLDLRGTSNIDTQKLMAKKVLLTARGSVQANIYASDELHSDTRGNVQVKVYGNPKVVTTSATGNGQVQVGH